jgi:hypothetical protein
MKPLQLVDLDLPLLWVMEDLHNLMRLGLPGQLLGLLLALLHFSNQSRVGLGYSY